MNTSSRFSRWMAVCFIAPGFLACLLLGVAVAFVGFTEVSGNLFVALTSIGAGILSLFLAVLCFRKIRQILMGVVKPWERATRMIMAADGLIVLIVLIAIPEIQKLRRYSAYSAVRGQLGTMRQNLADYQHKNGTYPHRLSDAVTPVPLLDLFDIPHRSSREVRYTTLNDTRDSGEWLYDNLPQDPGFGTLKIDCSHLDDKGHSWFSH